MTLLAASATQRLPLRPLYVATVLAGSFLPVLGGSPSVWNVAMLFYQAALLLGYLYANQLQRLPVHTQMLIHLGLFAVAAITLPIGMAGWYPPAAGHDPTLWLLGLLAVSIGPVFFVVSAQAPLMQAWFARTGDADAANPYFLYAASNLGSFGALLAYPLLVEPLAGLWPQRLAWSAGFVALAVLVALCGLRGLGSAAAKPQAAAEAVVITMRQRLRWVGLAAVASGLLLSTTTHLTTDLMAMPLLWVVPLAIYLLSFVIAFSNAGPAFTRRAVAAAPYALLLLGAPVFLSGEGPRYGMALAMAGLALLLVLTVALHGTLAQERPAAAGLTSFYLWMSVGGALGGLFCALAAPLLFSWPWEHPLLLLMAAALVSRGWRVLAVPVVLAGAMLLAGGTTQLKKGLAGIYQRSFFGVYAVENYGNINASGLKHGTTLHGLQSRDPARAMQPTTYYVAGSGIGQALAAVTAQKGAAARIGVVGLGTGTLACHAGQPAPANGVNYRFFEIDPVVVAIARQRFTYLSRCTPAAAMVVGDARLTLAQQQSGGFDLLAIDAFSSDAIPLHMMTREAFAIYGRALAADGLLVIHVTNRFLDLKPVVAALAVAGGWQAVHLNYRPPAGDSLANRSDWIALSRDPARIAALRAKNPAWAALPPANATVWSDDFASVLPTLRWRRT
jgi:hypothetical protein